MINRVHVNSPDIIVYLTNGNYYAYQQRCVIVRKPGLYLRSQIAYQPNCGVVFSACLQGVHGMINAKCRFFTCIMYFKPQVRQM